MNSSPSSVKQSQKSLKNGTRGIFRSRRSNLTSVFEIDQVFINYSCMMTYCHFRVKHGQNMLQIGMRGIFRSRRSNMTSVFKIDKVFINYSCMMTYCHSCQKRSGKLVIWSVIPVVFKKGCDPFGGRNSYGLI